jgi:hypothetical protein
MRLDDHVEEVQAHLIAAAALGDERTQQIAAGLAGAGAAAVRLAIMAALAEVTAEINAGLVGPPAQSTVSLRLTGDELQAVVEPMPEQAAIDPPVEEGDPTARISLRISDQLKAEVERAAARDTVSVNSWLIRAARAALGNGCPAPSSTTTSRPAHRVTGWVTG